MKRTYSIFATRVARALILIVTTVASSISFGYTFDHFFDSVGPGVVKTGMGISINLPASDVLEGASGYLLISNVDPIPEHFFFVMKYSGEPFNVQMNVKDLQLGYGCLGGGSYGYPCSSPNPNFGRIPGAASPIILESGLAAYAGASSQVFVMPRGEQPNFWERINPFGDISDSIRRKAHEATTGQEPGSDRPTGQGGGGCRCLWLAMDYELPIPVVAENGFTDFVWLRGEASSPDPNPPSWNATYVFGSEIPISHFIIPDALPDGDDEFRIIFDESGEDHVLHAGVAFDFTEYYPDGVSAFLLTGLSSNAGLLPNEAFPFEHGFRFTEEGPTLIGHGALSSGDYTLGGIVDENDYEVWRSSFGATGESPIDGNLNGRIDIADYVVWRDNFGKSVELGGQAQSLVPEPFVEGLLLIAVGAFACLVRRN